MALNNLASIYPFPARSGSSAVASASLAVADTAVSPVAYADTVDMVEFQVQTGTVRYRLDGTAPDASTGILLAVDSIHTWSRSKFNQAKFIRATATSAVIYSNPLQV